MVDAIRGASSPQYQAPQSPAAQGDYVDGLAKSFDYSDPVKKGLLIGGAVVTAALVGIGFFAPPAWVAAAVVGTKVLGAVGVASVALTGGSAVVHGAEVLTATNETEKSRASMELGKDVGNLAQAAVLFAVGAGVARGVLPKFIPPKAPVAAKVAPPPSPPAVAEAVSPPAAAQPIVVEGPPPPVGQGPNVTKLTVGDNIQRVGQEGWAKLATTGDGALLKVQHDPHGNILGFGNVAEGQMPVAGSGTAILRLEAAQGTDELSFVVREVVTGRGDSPHPAIQGLLDQVISFEMPATFVTN